MKRISFMTVIIILITNLVSADTRDHFIYDARNRYQIENLDALVSVQIKDYYAFADIGLVKTVSEMRKHPDHFPSKHFGDPAIISSGTTGTGSHGQEIIYAPSPIQNAIIQLQRNSLWILDAEITDNFKGVIQTNKIFIIMKPTRAYDINELPHNALKEVGDEIYYFGLIEVDEVEVRKSFRGLVCYLTSSLSFFHESISLNTDDIYNKGRYERVFAASNSAPCYVAREIGLNYEFISNNGIFKKQPAESLLMKSFKEKFKKNK